MTQRRGTEPLVSGAKKAVIHFSKATLELAAGIGDLVSGVVRTVRPTDDEDGKENPGPHRIDIE